MSDHATNHPQGASEEVAQLRDQVHSLMGDKVGPGLSNAADTAKRYAEEAREVYEEQSAALSERVREAPVAAVLVAIGVGYIIGRIAR